MTRNKTAEEADELSGSVAELLVGSAERLICRDGSKRLRFGPGRKQIEGG